MPRVVGAAAGYLPPVRILIRLMTTMTRLTVFSVGYVLGARAGREQYERIRSAARRATNDPPVQQAPAKADEPVGVHRLLADEHVDVPDELVYSTGPDIEGTVDELTPIGDGDRF